MRVEGWAWEGWPQGWFEAGLEGWRKLNRRQRRKGLDGQLNCVVNQKAVSAVSGSVRFGATHVGNKHRLHGRILSALRMVSSS